MAYLKITGSNGKVYAVKGGTRTPNSNVIGSVGDLYVRDNAGTGELWQKVTGDNTETGWSQVTALGTIGGQYINDAAAALGNVAIGAFYINSATGAITQRLT